MIRKRGWGDFKPSIKCGLQELTLSYRKIQQ